MRPSGRELETMEQGDVYLRILLQKQLPYASKKSCWQTLDTWAVAF